jgi:4-amino-4-deoxy-L-arabinose transferase-like glycosyltransferase
MDQSLNQRARAAQPDYLVFDPKRALTGLRSWVVAYRAELVCACLLGAMAVQMLAVISRKSITIDEIVLIPSGYYHLAANNFQLVNEHPPLVKIASAIPLLFIQPQELKPEQAKGEPGSSQWKWAHEELFWENNPQIFDALSWWARVPMILLTVLLGAIVFRFARDLFGPVAGVFAVALFTLEPTMLAHGRVVQTDVPAALGYLWLIVALYRYRRESSARRAAWVGAAAGVAMLAKFSMLLAGPIVAGFFVLEVWRTRNNATARRSIVVWHLAIVTLVAIVVINAGYLFQHRAMDTADVRWIQGVFPKISGPLTLLTGLLSHLLPADFVIGVLWQIQHTGEGHPAGLLGMYSRTGWWYYFPVAFFFKVTIPFLLLSLAALGWGGYEFIKKRDTRVLWLLAPFLIYSLFIMGSRINIGVRYYLPAYCFLFILGGGLLSRLLKIKRARYAGLAVVVVIMGWVTIEAARTYPNHLSYLNQLAWSRPHWWYLSDSNVEWGDDSRELGEYLRARGETEVRSAFLGDFFLLHHYGVQSFSLMSEDSAQRRTRYIAIGASFLNGSTVSEAVQIKGRVATELERENFFDAYRYRQPEAIIGGSIYLYRDEQH